jgi:c-di-GMP-binding flagellar brake protein YcgR
MPVAHRIPFQEMRLQVGERLQLVLHRMHGTIHYSTLIGYETGKYLLVKVPTENGVSVPMREGEEVTVRAFSGAGVYSFDCAVDMIQLSPHYYMHLSFPSEITVIPLRDAPRIRVNLPAQIRCGGNAAPKLAILSDLSISGAYITTDSEWGAPGEEVSVAFSFKVKPTNQEVWLELDGVIRSVHPVVIQGAASWNGIGVHFENVAPNDLVMLQHYLYDAGGGLAYPEPAMSHATSPSN